MFLGFNLERNSTIPPLSFNVALLRCIHTGQAAVHSFHGCLRSHCVTPPQFFPFLGNMCKSDGGPEQLSSKRQSPFLLQLPRSRSPLVQFQARSLGPLRLAVTGWGRRQEARSWPTHYLVALGTVLDPKLRHAGVCACGQRWVWIAKQRNRPHGHGSFSCLGSR